MKKVIEIPTDEQLKENIQNYTTEFNLTEFNERRSQFYGNKESIKKIRTCEYARRCVEVGCGLGFSWPMNSERFIVSFVCKPCGLYNKKAEERDNDVRQHS